MNTTTNVKNELEAMPLNDRLWMNKNANPDSLPIDSLVEVPTLSFQHPDKRQAIALKSLKKNGKSFDFARMFLGEEKGNAAARLYAFCRYCDDIADEYTDKSIAFNLLTNIQYQIKTNIANDPKVADYLCLCEQYNIDRMLAIELISGLIQDQGKVLLVTESELINYAYKVAGIVGLMMAPILRADKRGYMHAIDLGIAMQLTNIARDVTEDAQMGRRYIPGNWINHLTPKQILTPSVEQSMLVKASVKRLLRLADSYYQSGLDGLYYLPSDSRKAIAIAAKVYRKIGKKLEARHFNVYKGRVVTSKISKVIQAVFALCSTYLALFKRKTPSHHSNLHRFLTPKYKYLNIPSDQ